MVSNYFLRRLDLKLMVTCTGALFNIRTRSLNSMLYWSSQVVGSLIMATILDRKNLTRRARAFAGWSLVFVMVFIVHGWGYHYQK